MEVSILFLLALVTLGSAYVPSNSLSNDLSDERQRRSFNLPIIGSLFGEEEPEIPHLGQYPLWKVHRYNGISLQPIPLPEEEVPIHPLPPTHDVEAPSVVNVPNPHYAPKEPVQLPPNEYGPPANPPSGPYPSPTSPYPAPTPPSGPYPSPASPYPAPSSPSGPYPPSAPYPPVYNAPLPTDQPRGHSSSHAEASSAEFASPPIDSHFVDFLSHIDSGANIEGGLGGLLSILPSDIVQKLQQYISTPEGRERVSAIIGIASNAKKLKSGATRSLQDVIAKLFGGAGGSSKFALQSGTYTNIPHPYPAPQGLLNSFAAVGTGVSGSPLPHIPEAPELPKIPGLGPLPPTPGLPHINLPATSYFANKGVGGKYVSISLPQPSDTYVVPNEHVDTPTDSYGLPAQKYEPPAQTYGVPNPQIPSTSYGVPNGPTYPYQPPSLPAAQFHASQHHVYDHASAASETHEDYQSRDNNKQETDGDSESPVPLETTKLQSVQNPQSFPGDDLRRYLDVNHPAFKPSQPIEDGEDEFLEEGEE